MLGAIIGDIAGSRFESTSFEDAIRNAISIGGDSDTIGAITGGMAEAYYGIPKDIENKARTFLPERLLNIVDEFEKKFENKQVATDTKRKTWDRDDEER